MNKVLLLLTLAVGLALVKALVVALLIALLLVAVWALVTRPGETLASFGCVAIFGLATAHPIAFIIALSALGAVTVVLTHARRKSGGQTRLSDVEGEPRGPPLLVRDPRQSPD